MDKKQMLDMWNNSKAKKEIDTLILKSKDLKEKLINGSSKTKNDISSMLTQVKKDVGTQLVKHNSNKNEIENYKFNETDYHFMQSLSAAVLEHAPRRVSLVLYMWGITVFILIFWASFAKIDEITRGSGDVVASGDNKVIQNLEGGLVDEILVSEGEVVKADQILIKLTNTKSSSNLSSQNVKLNELRARAIRLHAEAYSKPFTMLRKGFKGYKRFVDLEEDLYNSNLANFKEQDSVIKEQVIQKQYEYQETKSRVKHLKKALSLMKEEVTMTAPMVKEGIKSKVGFLKLRREYNDIAQEYASARLSLPSLISQANELKGKRKEQDLSFKNKAKKELNEVLAEIERMELDRNILSDQVNRTYVRSPVDGIVQKLYVKTEGGVVRPGDDIVEIVPTNDTLLLEVKIKPSDIAFLHPGAKAVVKFSAYDFAIHGGLNGNITRISPDTVSDEVDGTYYLVYVKTEKTYLGTKDEQLEVIPGMLVDVDIITGEKTIMEYILKPILKSKQYAFSER